MENEHSNTQHSHLPIEEDEIDLLDLLLTIIKNKRLILATTAVFFCIALIASFTITPVYQAKATVFLSRSDQVIIDKKPEGVYSTSTITPEIITTLFSSTSVINKTKTSLPESERASFVSLQADMDNKTKVITLTAAASAPDTAAAAANHAIDIAQAELHSAIETRNLETAKLEDTLAFEIEEAKKSLSEKEVDFARYIQKVTPSKDKETSQLLYSHLELEKPQSATALFDLPDGGLEYLRYLREIQILEDQYLLLQQRKMALAELRRPVSIMALEKATPPSSFIKPKRTLMVVLATMLGLFTGVFAAFIMEFVRNAANDPKRAEKLAAIRKSLSLKK